MTEDISEPRLTVREVAEKLRIGRQTVRDLIHRGELDGTKVGSHYRITERSANKYLNRHREEN